jgi:hypothetical protein
MLKNSEIDFRTVRPSCHVELCELLTISKVFHVDKLECHSEPKCQP